MGQVYKMRTPTFLEVKAQMEAFAKQYPDGIPVCSIGCRCDDHPFEHFHTERDRAAARQKFQRDWERLQSLKLRGKITSLWEEFGIGHSPAQTHGSDCDCDDCLCRMVLSARKNTQESNFGQL